MATSELSGEYNIILRIQDKRIYDQFLKSFESDEDKIFELTQEFTEKRTIVFECKKSLEEIGWVDVPEEKEKWQCYEIHRANMPQYGCLSQCKECKEEQLKLKTKTRN